MEVRVYNGLNDTARILHDIRGLMGDGVAIVIGVKLGTTSTVRVAMGDATNWYLWVSLWWDRCAYVRCEAWPWLALRCMA